MANFVPVSRAEISALLPEQIFLKRRLRLLEEIFSPVSQTWLENSRPVKRAEKPM